MDKKLINIICQDSMEKNIRQLGQARTLAIIKSLSISPEAHAAYVKIFFQTVSKMERMM